MSKTPVMYTTVKGDTINKIIQKHSSKYPNLSMDKFLVVNKIKLSVKNKNKIKYLDYNTPHGRGISNEVYKTVTLGFSKGSSGPKVYNPSDGKVGGRFTGDPINKGDKVRVLDTKFINNTYLSQIRTPLKSSTIWINSEDLQGLTGNNTVSDYLSLKSNNDILVTGLVLQIPVEDRYENSYNINTNTVLSPPSNKITVLGTSKLKGKKKELNCFFQRIVNGVIKDVCYLPVIPQEFSDTNSPNFNSVAMMGRSVEYQIYNSTSRSVSFTLQLHEEIAPDSGTTSLGNYDYVHNVVDLIESCCYPDYDSQGAVNHPPEVLFNIGNQFRIRGVLESCSATWTTPFTDGKYVNCNLNLSVKETTGPYSSSEIVEMKGMRI